MTQDQKDKSHVDSVTPEQIREQTKIVADTLQNINSQISYTCQAIVRDTITACDHTISLSKAMKSVSLLKKKAVIDNAKDTVENILNSVQTQNPEGPSPMTLREPQKKVFSPIEFKAATQQIQIHAHFSARVMLDMCTVFRNAVTCLGINLISNEARKALDLPLID